MPRLTASQSEIAVCFPGGGLISQQEKPFSNWKWSWLLWALASNEMKKVARGATMQCNITAASTQMIGSASPDWKLHVESAELMASQREKVRRGEADNKVIMTKLFTADSRTKIGTKGCYYCSGRV